jgi:hypothetical protein
MWTLTYWRDLAERVTSSAAGGALTALGGGAINLWNVDARMVVGFAGGAALVSFLKGVVAAPFGDPTSASLLPRR